MSDTATALGLTIRRFSTAEAEKKLPKRVSFKDDAWVINIPAREEIAQDWRDSVAFKRRAVARDSWKNGRDPVNRRSSLATFPSSSLHANGGQRYQQTTLSSSGHEGNPAPYKSILKTSAPAVHGRIHLNRTYMQARSAREVSTRHSLDYDNFKQSLSNSTFPRGSKHRLEKPALARTVPGGYSSIRRRLSKEDCLLCTDKNRRFIGQEFSPKRTSSDNDFHTSEKTGVMSKTAGQPQTNFDIVGVTYGRVDKLPYFYDISGIMNSAGEYSPATNSSRAVDRERLAHSSVSTIGQFDSRKEEARHFSAIPAIAAFNRKNRKQFPSNCRNEYDLSPKRQLPIAWQPAKKDNFSTK